MSQEKAIKYLEMLQRQLDPSMRERISMDMGVDLNTIDQTLETYKNSMSRRLFNRMRQLAIKDYQKALLTPSPTKFQSRISHFFMLKMLKDIEIAAEELSEPLSDLPVLGTLPTGRVNAMAISVPDDGFIILLEEQILPFITFFINIVIDAVLVPGKSRKNNRKHSFSLRTGEDVQKHLIKNPRIVKTFGDLLTFYVIKGNLSLHNPKYIFARNSQHRKLSGNLIESAFYFVLAHEYAHIIKGHFSTDKRLLTLLGNENVSEIPISWEQEVEADSIAIMLMTVALNIKHGNTADVLFSLCAPHIFLHCIDMIQFSISILRGEMLDFSSSDTHPSNHLRRGNIEYMFQDMSHLQPEWIEKILLFNEVFKNAIYAMFHEFLPILYSHREHGRKVYSMWD